MLAEHELWDVTDSLSEEEDNFIRSLKFTPGGRALIRHLRLEQERIYRNWLKVDPTTQDGIQGFQGASQALQRLLWKLTQEELTEEESDE